MSTNKPSGTDQYSSIATAYKGVKSLPIYTKLYTPTYKKLLGDIKKKDVIDLACGEGTYTRIIRDMTEGRVVGVDISKEMIQLAKLYDSNSSSNNSSNNNSNSSNNNIEYIIADCCQELNFDTTFDIVSAVCLLNYSSSREMLLSFCKTAYNLLKPEGTFLGVTMNPFAKTREDFSQVKEYGFFIDVPNAVMEEGDMMEDTVKGDTKVAKFYFYYWSSVVYEWAFKEAGFDKVEWVHFDLVGNGGDEEEAREYFKTYLKNPSAICFRATKGN